MGKGEERWDSGFLHVVHRHILLFKHTKTTYLPPFYGGTSGNSNTWELSSGSPEPKLLSSFLTTCVSSRFLYSVSLCAQSHAVVPSNGWSSHRKQ